MTFPPPSIHALGDSAVTVRFGDAISGELSDHVLGLARNVGAEGIEGVIEVVPSYASFSVIFDPLVVRFSEVREHVVSILEPFRFSPRPARGASPSRVRLPIRIQVRYDGADVDEVARRTGMSSEEVIQLHSGREYRVFVLGFVPGFAYLGPLDDRLELPRREAPRKRVPVGSVAIAGTQTAVYPSSTPGGWHLIGTTAQTMFDPHADPAALLEVGDRVIFEPIG
ncbi:MAG: 5-oxoprolinase subunit PxpB [Gemmatimonadaceae bacterium]|nr:5-oxoprolinase subunit PxpB [Gemmatimonadaceae bacterium]